MIKKRQNWTDEETEEQIREAMRVLVIDRMPTSTELREIGMSSLDNRITRSYSYTGWAKKLGLKTKRTTTSMGDEYESLVKMILEDMGYEVEGTSNGFPYDLLVDNSVKIDVKATSVHYHFGGSRCHTFSLSKKQPTCDIYVLIALDEEKDIERTLIIPSHLNLPVTLNIGRESKYNVYEDRWEYIPEYVEFYESIKRESVEV